MRGGLLCCDAATNDPAARRRGTTPRITMGLIGRRQQCLFWIVMALRLSLSMIVRAAPRPTSKLLSRIRALPFLSNAAAFSQRPRKCLATMTTLGSAVTVKDRLRATTTLHQPSFRFQADRRSLNFWLLFRGGGGTAPGGGHQDPSFLDLSADRKPIPPLLHEYELSVCSVKGFRSYMEDEFVVTNDFCAVFDGHGGDSVSRYLRANLYAFLQAALPRTGHSSSTVPLATTSSSNPQSLANMAPASIQVNTTTATGDNDNDNDDGTKQQLLVVPTLDEYVTAAIAAYAAVDAKVQRISHWSYQGSTALGVWLHDDRNGTRHLIATNVGDSRAVLYRRNGTIVPLSRDHKPDDASERERIAAAGGMVVWCGKVDRDGRPIQGTGLYRLNGSLALSRAIGDRSERPAVSAVPDVCVERLTDDDEFVVLATDGLWDVMSTLDVVSFVHALLDDDDNGDMALDRDAVAAKLVEEALRRGSFDNVTVIILWLDRTFTAS